jgi:hypothetical protein
MSDANRSFQKGNALTGACIYSTPGGVIKRFLDIEAACVHSVEQNCLILEVGRCPCLGRPQIFLPAGFST